MTTDPRTTDMEYRLARLEETVRALTGMVESLVVIRHVGAYRTGNDGAPLGEVVHDEAAELVPSTAETAALTAVDLDALPFGAVVQDSDWERWEKTRFGRWYMHGGDADASSPRTLSSGLLLDSRGPITAEHAAEQPTQDNKTVLTAADLDALPEGTTVYDADGDRWAKTGTRWLFNNEGRPERAAALVRVYGPITATN